MTPRYGAIGLIDLKGRTGHYVRAGQRLMRRVPPGVHFGHVFVVAGYNSTVHGGPGGAYVDDLYWYVSGEDAPFTAFAELTDSTAREDGALAEAAYSLSKAPYAGKRGYLYLALTTLRLPSAWLRAHLDRSGAYLCSGLVVEIYRRAGIDLFPGHSVHDITPGDLARLVATDPRFTILKES